MYCNKCRRPVCIKHANGQPSVKLDRFPDEKYWIKKKSWFQELMKSVPQTLYMHGPRISIIKLKKLDALTLADMTRGLIEELTSIYFTVRNNNKPKKDNFFNLLLKERQKSNALVKQIVNNLLTVNQIDYDSLPYKDFIKIVNEFEIMMDRICNLMNAADNYSDGIVAYEGHKAFGWPDEEPLKLENEPPTAALANPS